MSQYDNTNTISLFPAKDTERLSASGKVNIDGWETRAVMVQSVTPTGKTVREIFVKAGAVFPVDNKGNEKAPAFDGPVDDGAPFADRPLKFALWARTKDALKYLSGVVSERQTRDGGQAQTKAPAKAAAGGSGLFPEDDEMPF